MTDQIAIREFDPHDMGLIYQSWLRSYRFSDFARAIRVSIYFSEHRHVVDSLVNTAKIVCAVNPEDPTHIYGWACMDLSGQLPIVHYVFIKPPYRGFGIAKLLLKGIQGRPFLFTHMTHIINRARVPGTYVPHLAFKGAA